MIPQSYKKIFTALVYKTRSRELQWQENQNGFGITFRTVSIDIIYWGGDDRIEFKIFNPKGEVVDGFSINKNDDEFNDADLLFEGARRSARQIDITLEELEEELGIRPKKDNTTPPPPKPPKDDDLPF